MLFERMQLIELLYSRLPHASEYILTGKTITSLSQTPSSIRVACDDGSEYSGDILIGADGVHSITRRLLFGDPHDTLATLPEGFSTTFRCIFGWGRLISGLVPGEMTERTKSEISSQLLTSDDTVCWFLYQRLPRTTRERASYTNADIAELAKACEDFSVVEDDKVRFGDLWKSRTRATLVDLEEGVMEKWFNGRVVLVGDAAHKMLPNVGLGCNNAIESVASLVNRLKALVLANPTPSTDELVNLFAAYQQERQSRAIRCTRISGFLLRYAWFLTIVLKFLSNFISLDNTRFIADVLYPWIPRDAIVLDFAPESCPKTGRIPWRSNTVSTKE